METAKSRYENPWRKQLVGKSKPEKLEILTRGILKFLVESEAGQISLHRVLNYLDFSRFALNSADCFLNQTLRQMESKGFIERDWGKIQITEAGRRFWDTGYGERSYAEYPNGAVGSYGSTLGASVKCVKLRFSNLFPLIMNSKVVVNTHSVLINAPLNAYSSRLDLNVSETALEKAIELIYGRKVKVSIILDKVAVEAKPIPTEEGQDKVSPPIPAGTCMEPSPRNLGAELYAVLHSFFGDGIKEIDGIRLRHKGLTIAIAPELIRQTPAQ